jgi:hypothetical protein
MLWLSGLHPETKERTVGFRLASFKEGSMGVGPVYCLRHLPDRMKETVKVRRTASWLLFQEPVFLWLN